MKRLVLVLAACASPPPPKPPVAPPPKCARVADHVLSLMSPTAQEPTETLDKFRNMFYERCSVDGWSAQAQDCFLAASSLQALAEQCESLLTPEQTQAFGMSIQSASSQQKTP